MKPVDLGEHAESLWRLMPPECQLLHDFCMARMIYGRRKYETAENGGREMAQVMAETREEIADALNRLAMMRVGRETRSRPTADLDAAAEYLLRAYYFLK